MTCPASFKTLPRRPYNDTHHRLHSSRGRHWSRDHRGLIIYRPQLTAIANDGFINAVLPHFDRRAALWFILFGVLAAMTGHLLIHAAQVGDLTAVRIAAWYLLGVSSVGTLTQTRSPSSLLIVLSLVLLGLSYFG